MSSFCSTHLDVAAEYRCDGCHRRLCPECIERGHRLLFCRLCGERALPLAAETPSTTPALLRAEKRAAAYGWSDALRYCFRGLGAYVYAGYAGTLLVLTALESLPGFGLLALLARLFILALLPGLLIAIVRSTAEGEVELPDWPDWSAVGERLSEIVALALIGLVMLLPPVLLLRLAGCGLGRLVDGGWGPLCWGALFGGLAVGAALAVPALGGVAVRQSGWWAPRLDCHLRALLATAPDSWITVATVTVVIGASRLLQAILAFVPLLGTAAGIAVGVYGTLTGAHLVGLLFRRHAATLERIY